MEMPLTTALHLRPNLQFDFSLFADSSFRRVGIPSQPSREEERERRLRQHVLKLAEAHAVGDWALARRWGKKVRGEASERGDAVQRVAWYMLQALEARADGTAAVKWREPIEFPVKSAADVMAAVGHSHETDIAYTNFAFAALLHEIPLFFGQLAIVLGLPVTFEMVDVPLESLHPGMVKVQPGEEVVVVSLWTLMLFPDDSVLRHNPRDAVLKWIQALKPRLVLLAEVDAALNGPFFLARVRETFRSMLAFFSAVHATMPDSAISPVRFIWETMLFRELINCVGCEGIQRLIRAERLEQWQERMRRLGFEEVGLGRKTQAAMRETTEGRDGRFEVVSVGGAARLMWKGQPVLAVSAWR
ncbi:unnamed protein product [Closterium sp. Yama58-4]|nr:unnamed protein product [Closterium sp. Yama58-4]